MTKENKGIDINTVCSFMQIDQLKGIEPFDVNDMMFFVQAPIETLAEAFSRLPLPN